MSQIGKDSDPQKEKHKFSHAYFSISCVFEIYLH